MSNENINAIIIVESMKSLGFYAEIVDYEVTKFGYSGPVLFTNANETEFLSLWEREYIDEELYFLKYDPVSFEIFSNYADGSWCSPLGVGYDLANKPNTLICSFPQNEFVEVIINQPVRYNTDKVICFYSKGDYPEFSNFYPAEMEIETYQGSNPDGTPKVASVKTYATVEHYFQIMKALEFDPDGETLKQMGNHLTCTKIKSLGRKVQNFDAAVWNIRRRFHMRDALAMKFYQNEELREMLLSTGDAILAEASPRDTFWGIGYSGSNPKAFDPAQWRGRNVLGNMLMYLRDAIREGEQSEKT